MIRRLFVELGKLSSNRLAVISIYCISVIYFVGLILSPAILGILTRIGAIGQVLSDPILLNRAISALISSFELSGLVSTLDLLAGFPLAWMIVRAKDKWTSVLDSIVDLPLIVPTVTLGYSALLFWSSGNPLGFLGFEPLSPGWMLVLLLHFSFSYPVVVRVMVGKIKELDQIYEIAGRTLGAKSFTVARSISVPLLSSGMVASFLLAFARSLSETGATIVVAGLFENGAVFIKRAKDAGIEGPLVFTSLSLIIFSLIIYYSLRYFGVRVRFPFRRAWPDIENKLSSKLSIALRDIMSALILFIFVVLPTIYLGITYLPHAFQSDSLSQILTGAGPWGSFWNSFLMSYVIGFLVSLLNTLLILPMAIIIARKRFGTPLSLLFDGLTALPLIIPSVALGTSLNFFWSSFRGFPEFWLIVLSHLSITYPYLVATLVSALEDIPIYFEESARTLGADPFTVFRTVTLPIAKHSLLSGVILTFTRSVDETGATLAVSQQLRTVPVLLVDWIVKPFPGSEVAVGIGTMLLLLTSLVCLLTLRLLTMKGD